MKAYELEYRYMYMRLLGIQVFIIIHVRLVLPINQLNIICHLYSFNQCFKVFVPYFTILVLNDKELLHEGNLQNCVDAHLNTY